MTLSLNISKKIPRRSSLLATENWLIFLCIGKSR